MPNMSADGDCPRPLSLYVYAVFISQRIGQIGHADIAVCNAVREFVHFTPHAFYDFGVSVFFVAQNGQKYCSYQIIQRPYP